MGVLTGVLILALYVVLLVITFVLGRPSRFTLLEHQRGVLYRRGVPVREVQAGRYWVWTKREKIFWADTRPLQVSFEGQGAVLKDGVNAIFGILASARVVEARKAIYVSRNCYEVPAFVLHCFTRSVLNEFSASEAMDAKERLATDIIARAGPVLSAYGFHILSLQVTQFSIAGPAAAEE